MGGGGGARTGVFGIKIQVKQAATRAAGVLYCKCWALRAERVLCTTHMHTQQHR